MRERLQQAPFSLSRTQKAEWLIKTLKELTTFHYNHCTVYRQMMDATGMDFDAIKRCEDIPFFPAQLFKTLHLVSASAESVVLKMTSSSTTGQSPAQVYLDADTAYMQRKVLTKIYVDMIGKERLPMLIIDCPEASQDTSIVSARAAGIRGFSLFARERSFALDQRMNIDFDGVEAFLEKHRGQPFLLFGFTYIVWQYFWKAYKLGGRTLPDLSNAILIHGGGWKKLATESVSADTFKNSLYEQFGITTIRDYYGMAAQAGSIYMECEYGHLHASIFSEIIVRRPSDFSVCSIGERGMIQSISVLPRSYCGHSLLTDDEGVVLGEDDCRCGRLGKYFKVTGRIMHAELRGCGDVHGSTH